MKRLCKIPDCNSDISETKDYGGYVIYNSQSYDLCKKH